MAYNVVTRHPSRCRVPVVIPLSLSIFAIHHSTCWIARKSWKWVVIAYFFFTLWKCRNPFMKRSE